MEIPREKVEILFKKDYFVVNIVIRPNRYMEFILKKSHEDPLEKSFFSILSYYPDDELWYYQHNAVNSLTFLADFATNPNEEYVAIVGSGVDIISGTPHAEKSLQPIHPNQQVFPLCAKTLSDGKIYVVESGRIVRRRNKPNEWELLSKGLPSYEETELEQRKTNRELGFDSIDSFSANDIYAAGGDCDLWHWNGKKWTPMDLPFNSNMISDALVCGGDGKVYINTNDGIIMGVDNHWEYVDIDDDLDIIIETMAWYKDRLYVATATQLYQVKDGEFSISELDSHENRPYYWRTLGVGAGIMVAGYLDSIVVYDGQNLEKILSLPNSI